MVLKLFFDISTSFSKDQCECTLHSEAPPCLSDQMMHFHVCFVYISVDHRVVMSLETMDFFPASTASKKLVKLARVQDVENCDSSAFVAFWLGPNQVRYTALLPSKSGPMPLKFTNVHS